MLINPEGSYSNINLRGRSKSEQLRECKEDNKIFTLSTYSVLGTLRTFPHLIITTGLLSTPIIPILKIFLLCQISNVHARKGNAKMSFHVASVVKSICQSCSINTPILFGFAFLCFKVNIKRYFTYRSTSVRFYAFNINKSQYCYSS